LLVQATFGGGRITLQATILELEPAIQTEIPRFFAEWGEATAMLDSWAGLTDRTKLRVSDFAIAAMLHGEHRNRDAIALLETMSAHLQDRHEEGRRDD
jgi:hypothetical protein